MDQSASLLLKCPPKFLLLIAKCLLAPASRNLKSLSLTCRALRPIAQSILLETVRVSTAIKSGPNSSVNTLAMNASIRTLTISGPTLFRERLEGIQSILPNVLALESLNLFFLHLEAPLLALIVETAARKPLQLKLMHVTISHTPILASAPLFITSLSIREVVRFGHEKQDVPYMQALIEQLCRASSDHIEELWIESDEIYFPILIDLPMPRLSRVSFFVPEDGVASFLKKHPSITYAKFDSYRKYSLSLPMSALPNLRELIAWPSAINALVPGRPIQSLTINANHSSANLSNSVLTLRPPIMTVRLGLIDSDESTLAWLQQVEEHFPMLRRLQFYPSYAVGVAHAVQAQRSIHTMFPES
jgi:hypothetical protein